MIFLSLLSRSKVWGVGFWLLDHRLSDHRFSDHYLFNHRHSHKYHCHSHKHLHRHEQANSHLLSDSPISSKPLSSQFLMPLNITGSIGLCLSALVLFLSVVALHQAAYGMVLISAFSPGRASVLVAIGLLAMYAQQWFDHLPNGTAIFRYSPMIGAIAAIVAGVAITAISDVR